MPAEAQAHQRKGAEVQKATVRRKVAKALVAMRREFKSSPDRFPRRITLSYVLRRSGVSPKTLRKDYHAETLDAVQSFLLEADTCEPSQKPEKPSPKPRKTTWFDQLSTLAQEHEALRHRTQSDIDRLSAERDRLAAELDKAVAEVRLLRKRTWGKTQEAAGASRSSTAGRKPAVRRVA